MTALTRTRWRQFHTLAARAVDNLRAAGYWADYIDPTSGKAVRLVAAV